LLSGLESVALSTFEQSAFKKNSPGFVNVDILLFEVVNHLPDLIEVAHPFLNFDGFDK
jgi:hypothetical protein